MAIDFKSVNIRRNWDGKLVGKLEVSGDFGGADLNLTEELCAAILDVCAANIVKAAEETAKGFRQEAMMIGVETVDHA